MNELKSYLRLLQPANDLTPPGVPFINLNGSRWILNDFYQLPAEMDYTCVSYAWGEGKSENPLNIKQLISDKTIPVIEAILKASNSPENWANIQLSYDPHKNEAIKLTAINATRSLWIDAICTPTQDVDRVNSLRSLGKIYSSARQVFAVLSKSTSAALRQISDTGHLDSSALFILENDEWITRSWTYQEVVNSRSLYFLAQDDNSTIVSGVDFLSAVLAATDDYRVSFGISSLTWSEQYPKLDALECLIADYKIAQYAERSAYQVMSAMHRRVSQRSDDHFFAMVGAIAISPLEIDDDLLSPAEYFMQACEAKGDYSFIYNIAPRNETNGRRWRPVEGKFPPVFPELVIFGNGQLGHIESTHIQLENMYRLVPGSIGIDGLKAIVSHLSMAHKGQATPERYSSPKAVADSIHKLLIARGFSGCGEYLEFENGFFFPQSKPNRSSDILVAISLSVRWEGGAPGVILRASDSGIHEFCDIGAFVGRIPKSGQPICIG